MDWNWYDLGVQTAVRGEPWGEEDAIPLTVCLSDDEPESTDAPDVEEAMSEGQIKAFELTRNYASDLYTLIVEALEEHFSRRDDVFGPEDESFTDETYDAYEDQLYGGYDDQPGDGAPISDLFDSYDDEREAESFEEESFEEQFSIQEIFIFDTDGATAEWGVTGHAEFEPEHGIGVVFDYNEVEEVGYQDVVLSRLR